MRQQGNDCTGKEASIINHRINVASDLLPASAKYAKVIVMYEEASVAKDAAPDILALARAAQASFPKQDNVELQQEIRTMHNEWERKL
jgi:UDP-N-acetylenolpyruvoylglucosamine reductase